MVSDENQTKYKRLEVAKSFLVEHDDNTIKMHLEKAGFDLNKEIICEMDVTRMWLIYTQKGS